MKQSKKVCLYARWFKRPLDFAASLFLIVLFAPVLFVVSCVIALTVGSPIFFRQPRPGRHGVTFEILKFKTMRDISGAGGDQLSDAVRMTRVGKIIRSTSLDELPELINVIRGDMSLIGPRPLLVKYWHLYTPRQRRRHEVRPGITGWAQVNGRNSITWEKKFELDVWYVENMSFMLDVKILALTVWRILVREGISQPGHVTAEEFRGS